MVEGDLLSKVKQKKYLHKGIFNKGISNCGPLCGPYNSIFLQELTMTVPLDIFGGQKSSKKKKKNWPKLTVWMLPLTNIVPASYKYCTFIETFQSICVENQTTGFYRAHWDVTCFVNSNKTVTQQRITCSTFLKQRWNNAVKTSLFNLV